MKIARLDIPVTGGTLAAFRFGSAPDDAPLVLAVHGITGNAYYWLPVARVLGERVRFVSVDLRGRGDSRELPGPFGTAAHAADLVSTLDHLGEDTALVTGHSLGAYITARFAVDHADRLSAAVLVDGGLPIPGSENVDPQVFLDAFLGPTLQRLGMRFTDLDAYLAFWHAHPAFAGKPIPTEDLAAFAEHDLTGEPPELRSTVAEAAVRGDAAELHSFGSRSYAIKAPATMLAAPRGLQDNPEPMLPLALAQEWAAGAPELRRAVAVPDCNHYTIVMGAGAELVAAAIADLTS